MTDDWKWERALQTEAAEPASVEIWLERESEPGEWRGVSACLKFSGHGQKVVPDRALSIDKMFAPAVAEQLTEQLSPLQETCIISRAAFSISLPGVRLGGLRILTRVGADGSASATVRFSHAIGNLCAIFRPPLGDRADPVTHDADSLALRCLQELLRPALEVFDHILDHGLSETDAKVLRARIKTMRARRDELSDYIGLLTRYAEEEGARRPAPRQAAGLHLSVPGAAPNRTISWAPETGPVRGENAAVLHGHHDRTGAESPSA